MRAPVFAAMFHIALLTLVSAFGFAAEDALPEGIRRETFRGWPDCFVISAPDAKVSLTIVPAIGGRILDFSRNGQGFIWITPGTDGKTLANTPSGNFWAGGYNVDIGPEIKRPVDHKTMWMGPWKAEPAGPYSVRAQSEDNAATGIRLSKVLTLDPKTGALTLVQTMKNISDKETNYCLWDRTLCNGGGFCLIPLNKKSRFAKGWSFRLKQFDDDAYETNNPESPNCKVMDGVLVAQATGKYGKIGADSDAGWMAYVRGKQALLKTFKYFPEGQYTDGGNSVEFYWSEQVGEVEPLSPQVKLAPGGEYTFTEVWHLLDLPEEVTSFEQARAQVDRLAPKKE